MSDIEIVIIESAKSLFISKGFNGTTMREIANHAGVNLAMINYYFRSKEKLFDIVFFDIFGKLLANNSDIIYGNQTIFEKIEMVVDNYFDLLMKNPQLPIFVLGELSRNPDLIIEKVKSTQKLESARVHIITELTNEIENGVIRPVDPLQLIINIVSLSVFPFMAKSIIDGVCSSVGGDFDTLMAHRRESVKQFILNAIKK